MTIVRISDEGAITIPSEVLANAGMRPGDSIIVKLVDHTVVLEDQSDIVRRTAGSLAKYAREINRGLSIDEIIAREKAAFEQAIVEDYLESERSQEQK